MVKNQLEYDIKKWLDRTNFVDFSETISKRVIGQEELTIVLANVYNYLSNIVDGNKINNNMLLAAPSGSGKTETYRALKEYFKEEIPTLRIMHFDMSELAPTSYRGVNMTDILKPFADAGIHEAVGLIFLDEFDKKLVPSITSGGNNINQEIQSGILGMVEGADIRIPGSSISVDTNKLMFIGMGSYDSFRKEKNEKPREMGFNRCEDKDEKEVFYEHISREDILSVGGSNELIGRFPYLVNYDRLSKDAVLKVIDNIIADIADSFNIFRLVIEDTFEEQLLSEANSKFGCRGLDSTIRTLVLKAYTKAITSKEQSDALIINLQDKNTYNFEWVSYENLIPESQHELLDMALKTLIKNRPHINQEDAPWHVSKEADYDNVAENECDAEMIDLSRILMDVLNDASRND